MFAMCINVYQCVSMCVNVCQIYSENKVASKTGFFGLMVGSKGGSTINTVNERIQQ